MDAVMTASKNARCRQQVVRRRRIDRTKPVHYMNAG
jgi:hypothetical protein